MPLISICIPTYRNTNSLRRLLNSIREQSFRDYEVVICDDTPGPEVVHIVADYTDILGLKYHQNSCRLGSPANWNQCLSLATGKWIKMMHHDDWFRDASSLAVFAEAASNLDGSPLLFSSCNAFRNGQSFEFIHQPFAGHAISEYGEELNADNLIFANKIGCPSVTMFRRLSRYQYDVNLVWLVDVDFYVSAIREGGVLYIDEPLVNVTFSADTQITSAIEMDARLRWRELFYLSHKYDLLRSSSVRRRLELQCHEHRLYRISDLRMILSAENAGIRDWQLVVSILSSRIGRRIGISFQLAKSALFRLVLRFKKLLKVSFRYLFR